MKRKYEPTPVLVRTRDPRSVAGKTAKMGGATSLTSQRRRQMLTRFTQAISRQKGDQRGFRGQISFQEIGPMSLNTTAAEVAAATKLNGCAFVADLQWLLTCCEERFLTDTSKWILEIMAYCPEAWIRSFAETATDVPSTSTSNSTTGSIQWPTVTPENRNLLFGKNLLLNRDFARASFFLQKSKSIGTVERFLYYWSKYLGCIRTRLENDAEAIDRKAVEHTDDRNFADLLRDIGRENRSSDIFLLYLEGKIQAALGVPKAAAATMKEVLKLESRFWPAWQELVQLIEKVDDIAVCKALCNLSPESSWMPDWFESLALSRFHMDSDALKKAELLISRGLPGIPMILTQIAACSNHLHEVDPQDYRGWYGLGQMYDIIKMPTYSLFYYQQAHLCKPQDSRMLVALGDVYQKMGRLRNAEKCFISAFKYGDVEGTALWMLAKLYESENQMQRAARSYEEYLREYQEIEESDENVVYCVQFLAKHYLEQRDVEKAIYYGQKCLEHDSISEEGRFVLRTAEAMKEEQEKEKGGEARPVDDSFYSTAFDITQASSMVVDDSEMVISEGEGDESF
ncbi:tetratricopeptide repeat protein [Ancylostoma ceylanicum]|uniref:Tetratricopeptide repeat protein n=1 Tax=Ancylostoma ceylanicum TaxID=53326 RepID=A0A0D6M9Y3_9BILA|nr:tetratricopeptide repeat protein [Ancylostoma ceylanicum]